MESGRRWTLCFSDKAEVMWQALDFRTRLGTLSPNVSATWRTILIEPFLSQDACLTCKSRWEFRGPSGQSVDVAPVCDSQHECHDHSLAILSAVEGCSCCCLHIFSVGNENCQQSLQNDSFFTRLTRIVRGLDYICFIWWRHRSVLEVNVPYWCHHPTDLYRVMVTTRL